MEIRYFRFEIWTVKVTNKQTNAAEKKIIHIKQNIWKA